MRAFLGLVLLLGFGCTPDNLGTRELDRDVELDETGPEITHEYDPSPRTYGREVFLNAVVVDESEIMDVFIVFQRETDGNAWTTLRMAPIANDFFEGIIPGNDVSSGGIRYYVKAIDEFDNDSCLPEACSKEAWHFPVVPGRE
jgi:hypothetical protein